MSTEFSAYGDNEGYIEYTAYGRKNSVINERSNEESRPVTRVCSADQSIESSDITQVKPFEGRQPSCEKKTLRQLVSYRSSMSPKFRSQSPTPMMNIYKVNTDKSGMSDQPDHNTTPSFFSLSPRAREMKAKFVNMFNWPKKSNIDKE